MELAVVQARWQTGDLLPEDVPAAAVALLDAGIESPAIVTLAGMSPRSRSEIDGLVRSMFRENGLSAVGDRDALWVVACDVARRIVARQIEPKRGAEIIWRVATDLDLPDSLGPFVYLGADYGEGPGTREEEEAWFDAEIIGSAHILVEQASAP